MRLASARVRNINGRAGESPPGALSALCQVAESNITSMGTFRGDNYKIGAIFTKSMYTWSLRISIIFSSSESNHSAATDEQAVYLNMQMRYAHKGEPPNSTSHLLPEGGGFCHVLPRFPCDHVLCRLSRWRVALFVCVTRSCDSTRVVSQRSPNVKEFELLVAVNDTTQFNCTFKLLVNHAEV